MHTIDTNVRFAHFIADFPRTAITGSRTTPCVKLLRAPDRRRIGLASSRPRACQATQGAKKNRGLHHRTGDRGDIAHTSASYISSPVATTISPTVFVFVPRNQINSRIGSPSDSRCTGRPKKPMSVARGRCRADGRSWRADAAATLWRSVGYSAFELLESTTWPVRKGMKDER